MRFNPRSREGNDVNACGFSMFVSVSIHVPARGTTCPGRVRRCGSRGFNPRSREGNDDIWQESVVRLSPVSIHVPARGTTKKERSFLSLLIVSIHVPARGTTKAAHENLRLTASFNPRSREGNDARYNHSYSQGISFNPRSREGNDAPERSEPAQNSCFNPRSREGNDLVIDPDVIIDFRFQSTFPRGERRGGYGIHSSGIYVSIHVPARGTTRCKSS